MMVSLAFRGPDAQRLQIVGQPGLGHTLLNVDDVRDSERQPLTLDGRVWIVADARIDARADLLASLRASGDRRASADAGDAELIVRSYDLWGDACVEHLLGDFTFVIWDAARRRLFAARDQLGVKPLFYAQLASTVIVSNTLDCVRRHSAVSGEPHDPAIAEFLLFGVNRDGATTAFRDVRRVPAAHSLTCSIDATTLRRYWTLPVDEPMHLRRIDE